MTIPAIYGLYNILFSLIKVFLKVTELTFLLVYWRCLDLLNLKLYIRFSYLIHLSILLYLTFIRCCYKLNCWDKIKQSTYFEGCLLKYERRF